MEVYCIVNKTITLEEPTKKTYLIEPLMYDNVKAHAMQVTVQTNEGTPASLSGIGVSATMMLYGNDTTVTGITGTVSGNVARVILPAACYAVPGYFVFTMNFTKTGYSRTVMIVEGRVEQNNGGTPVDPGTPVTNYSTIIANANAAATAANQAAQQVPNIEDAIAPTFEDVMQGPFPISAYTQHCWHNNGLYVNKVQINAAESWTSSHWKRVDISGELANANWRLDELITDENTGLLITLV